jgi:hypothetical protein
MKCHLRVLSVVLLSMVGFLGAAQQSRAVPFSAARIIIEVNSSAEDGGIQIFVDGTGWNRFQVFDPNGQEIFDVMASHSVGKTGVTELFFESAEPSFQDLPLDQLLARFPAGKYRFEGVTVGGKLLTAQPTLKHNIPAGPVIVSPPEGATLAHTAPLVIDWNPVTQAYPGTALPVKIAGYQVIVERVKPTPLIKVDVTLPATVTQMTVPAEFLQANADYIIEVLAIEASGNQTITEGSFKTAP